MITLSLCMIVKNEEDVLARCLESVKDCVDEIVIADTGSQDNTKEIARRYHASVYDFPWQDDFAAARNFALSKTNGDYFLWLDADDYISPENAEKLLALKDALQTNAPDMVMCPYQTAFDEDGTPLCSFFRERIMKRSAQFLWTGRVHECIAPRGNIMRSDFCVFHLSGKKPRGARNLHIYQKWSAEERLSERDLFYYGRELYYNRLYDEAKTILEKMLQGDGWYVNKIEACKILGFCYAEQGDTDKAKQAFLRSFAYGPPRAGICCELGKIFRAEQKLREAVFWYETARTCGDYGAEGDFDLPESRTYVPLIELTCCYYELGERDKAIFCHKETERLFPSRPAVRFNRRFFEQAGLL